MLSPDMNLRLNRQMTAEYYSFWLYTAMSGWAASKNRHGFAHWLALQAEEEKRHAERFFHYIIERHGTIQLDGIPKPPEQWVSTFLLNLRKAEKAMFSDDFRASLDDNAAYVYIVDPNTHEIIYNNKAIVKKSGDFVGQKCHKVFINIDEPCGKCPIPNMSDPDKPHIAEIVRPDGMAVLTHVSPIHWEGRGVALVSCIDITDSKKAEAALKTEKDPPSDLGRQ